MFTKAAPGHYITALVVAGSVAAGTGGSVIPGHEWIGASIVFFCCVLFLTAGAFLRSWGNVSTNAVKVMLHEEMDGMREEIQGLVKDLRNESNEKHKEIWTALDNKADKR